MYSSHVNKLLPSPSLPYGLGGKKGKKGKECGLQPKLG